MLGSDTCLSCRDVLPNYSDDIINILLHWFARCHSSQPPLFAAIKSDLESGYSILNLTVAPFGINFGIFKYLSVNSWFWKTVSAFASSLWVLDLKYLRDDQMIVNQCIVVLIYHQRENSKSVDQYFSAEFAAFNWVLANEVSSHLIKFIQEGFQILTACPWLLRLYKPCISCSFSCYGRSTRYP